MTTLSSVVVRIAADTSQLQAGLRGVPTAINSQLGNIGRAAALTARALGGIGAVAGTAFVGFIRSGISAADTAGKLAQKIGISTEQLTRYQYAAELGDVSTEQFGTSLIKFSTNLDKAANGQKKVSEQFARLGVDTKTAEGQVRPVSAVFEEVIDKLSRLPDGATKSRIAIALFGQAGADLIPLINGGTKSLQALGDEAERTGNVISDNTAAAADQFNDSLDRLGKVADGIGISLANTFLPGISKLAEEFARAAVEGDGLFRVLKAIPTAISRVMSGTDTEQLGKLENALLGLEATAARIRKENGDPAALKMIEERITIIRAQIKGLQVVIPPPGTGARTPAAATELDNPALTASDPAAEAAAKRRQRAIESAQKAAARERQAAIDAEAAYIRNLEQSLALENDSSEAARVRFDLVEGEAKAFTAAGKARIEQIAREIDLQRESAEVQEELIEIARQREEDALAKSTALAEERAQTITALRTPLERYADEVNRLLRLGLDQENLNRGIVAAQAELERVKDKAEEANDVAEELGLTFSSAFEDAIVEGAKFSDVLAGIEKDLLRLGTRKLVTEPLTNALGGLLEGGSKEGGGGGLSGIFSKLLGFLPGFATGGSFTVGGSGGIDSQIVAFRATPGETVDVGHGGMRPVVVNLSYANPPRTPYEMQSASQQAAAVGQSVRKALTRNT